MNIFEENRKLRQALVDADFVARQRGDKFGLCDSIDNKGNPYPSADIDHLLKESQAQGIRPIQTFGEALEQELVNGKWRRISTEK